MTINECLKNIVKDYFYTDGIQINNLERERESFSHKINLYKKISKSNSFLFNYFLKQEIILMAEEN